MAAGKRGIGPGAYESNGVVCTMDAPFKKGQSTGEQKNLTGTFDQARSGGANNLPTRVTDTMGGPTGTPKHGPATASPSAQGYTGMQSRSGAK